MFLLTATALILLVYFSAHVFETRLRPQSAASPQGQLLKRAFLFNLAIGGSWLLLYFSGSSNLPRELTPAGIIYLLILINCGFYVYFHLFNMSETARRIHILISLLSGEIQTRGELEKRYQENTLVDNRLERLLQMKEIRQINDGRYIAGRGPVYWSALILSQLRRVYGLPPLGQQSRPDKKSNKYV